jgi:hypothetical protein
MALVQADVAKDGVSAPAAVVPGLQQVIANAREDGIDLKVVVLEQSPPIDTPLRDIATEVGHANAGSTVLVVSPGWAGAYSTTFDRVTLEAGQDIAKTANPVQSAQNFVDQLKTPDFPWTAITIVLLIGVFVAVIGTRIIQVRSKRTVAADTDSAQPT